MAINSPFDRGPGCSRLAWTSVACLSQGVRAMWCGVSTVRRPNDRRTAR